MPGNALPDKLFFKIGEVAQIVGVRAHVLRYWESEFAALRPMKTRGSHRVYRRRDVELAVLLRRLLHEEGLTIAGAKRRLREQGLLQREPTVPEAPAAAHAVEEADERAELVAMRDELTELLTALEQVAHDEMDGADDAKQEIGTDGDGTASSVPVHTRKRPVV
ncbi:MAG TPA: MerR family transcriptional regulator [Polyangiales bacterium]|nr:MerR family transcriptional regulator [Polyangiales bacterium]